MDDSGYVGLWFGKKSTNSFDLLNGKVDHRYPTGEGLEIEIGMVYELEV